MSHEKNDDAVEYETPGNPVHEQQEGDVEYTTPGNPHRDDDDENGGADVATPGVPIADAQHEAEKNVPHATPGNNSALSED
ncbi:hypothetical protein [Okibacterium fritillariae]|uniref:Uncharacterized protein n=1 Tax=Okibacterium fritillariae TaxID=123320 RepID=A0A1T5I8D6_9MICO|nr:hypothetical protein [Okibacterium fritillariae]SKC35142.1 hypothetical protein SAMN06309945_0022 [Okibacterium fritillariae]